MQLSFIGFAVCAITLIVAYYSRGMLIIGLVASLAFGSTAMMTLTSLGGSSPLIYTLFAALLVMAVAARRRIWLDLGGVFGSIRPVWVLMALMSYAIVGAWLLPRFFAGQTSVFVQSRTRTAVVEASLAPVSANISQTGYFILGGLTAIALCALLMHSDRIGQVRRGFFLWCSLHATMGLIDFLGKSSGAGDLLAPLRTANYAIITGAEEAGFTRIAGAYSEASAFGGVSLACLAFCYTYWRNTKSRPAFWLALILLALIILSTSSTAYVGLAVLSVPVSFSIARALISNRVQSDDVVIMALLACGLAGVLGVALFNAGFFDQFVRLIEAAVINKSTSSSGLERTYWNLKSLQAFVDTSGLGIGFGSSRASSWPIAVLSQLGLLGALMMAMLLGVVVRGLGNYAERVDSETEAVVASVRNCALASIVSGSLVSGTADPGIVFFIALAVISATRARARRVIWQPRESSLEDWREETRQVATRTAVRG